MEHFISIYIDMDKLVTDIRGGQYLDCKAKDYFRVRNKETNKQLEIRVVRDDSTTDMTMTEAEFMEQLKNL